MAKAPRSSSPKGGSADKESRLREMAAAPAEPAPDLLTAEDAPRVERRPPRLPQPCPVIPLGVFGKHIVFLDGLQQIVMEAPRSCDKGALALWFGDEWLVEQECFLARDKNGKPTGKFDQDKVQMALIADCRARRIFNPQGKVLGRGAHKPKSDEAGLVLHTGNRVLVRRGDGKAESHLAGMVEIGGKDLFFPADDALPPPADRASGREEGEALLALFRKWSWAEPGTPVPGKPGAFEGGSPLLLLGWVAQAFICGALDWRSHVWLPGPTASGKTSLQKIIRAVLDDWCLATGDATAAGLQQTLRNDTLAVSIDEAEPHDNPDRQAEILYLMKKASSGEKKHRGGADHKASEFTAQSCFLLSSVLHATLKGEDRNRIALLVMHKLADDVPPLDMELALWRSAGRRLHRRMIEQWARFERTLACYKRAIGEQRYEGRWQDTFGTLLACADLLRYDYAPDDPSSAARQEPDGRVTEAVLSILPMLAKSRVEARSDTERAMAHLLSKALPGSGGAPPETIGTWLDRAMTALDEGGPNETARKKLMTHGMRVVMVTAKPDPANPGRTKPGIADALVGDAGWQRDYLALAYPTHAELQTLWRGTEWVGDGYKQSLGKLDGALMPRRVRFNSAGSDNAVLIPLSAFIGDEG